MRRKRQCGGSGSTSFSRSHIRIPHQSEKAHPDPLQSGKKGVVEVTKKEAMEAHPGVVEAHTETGCRNESLSYGSGLASL
jgi:hypothetical protein